MTQAQTISTRKHAYSPHPIMAGNRETFDRPKDIEASNCTADPNPASDWVSFNYTLPDSEVEGFIKISDVNGKVIKTLTLSGMHGQKFGIPEKQMQEFISTHLRLTGFQSLVK